MKVVTTVHKAGFQQYGHRWIESIQNWPVGTEFVMYPEGFTPDCDYTRCEDLPRLEAFKKRHAAYRSPSWRHDVVRFSNKVFAAHDAFYQYKGIGVWLDADCVTYRQIPEGFIEGLRKAGDYMACFLREGMHPETGLWVVDCAHPEHQAFMDTLIRAYEDDTFKLLPEWHDAYVFGHIVRLFVRDGRFTVTNLSGKWSKTMHPMASAETSKYIDHCKGDRKDAGFSPECDAHIDARLEEVAR